MLPVKPAYHSTETPVGRQRPLNKNTYTSKGGWTLTVKRKSKTPILHVGSLVNPLVAPARRIDELLIPNRHDTPSVCPGLVDPMIIIHRVKVKRLVVLACHLDNKRVLFPVQAVAIAQSVITPIRGGVGFRPLLDTIHRAVPPHFQSLGRASIPPNRTVRSKCIS